MVKRPELGFDHSPLSNPDVKETVELYLYSTYWLSWLVIG
jgi:hypothetical protein